MTSKFRFEHWIDYARGLGSPERRQAMAATLEDGNREQARLFELAQAMVDSAEFLSGADVPRDVMQRAVAVFEPYEPESVWRLPALPIRLLFDSLLEPRLAGVRAQGAQHRETIHQAGEFQLSLRLEQEQGTELVAVIGQIVPNENIRQAVAHRPVFVFQKEKLVARTLSGDSGEFQLEFSGKQPLRLVLALAEPDRRIEVDLEPIQGSRRSRRPKSN